MILIGIGMLITGVLLGALLIYLWTRPKPAPRQEPVPDPQPRVERPLEQPRRLYRRDISSEAFDRMDEVFTRMDDVFDGFLGERPTSRRQRTDGGLFQTRTVTVTRTPVAAPEAVPTVQPPVPVPTAVQPPVTLFDHLAKEDEPT